MASSEFQKKENVEWEDAGNGVSRQVFGYDDKIMLVKAKFVKGGIGTAHKHIHSQVTYVESGSFIMTIGEKKEMLKAGDGYYVPPNIMHSCVCIEAGMLIDAFSPVREDFLK